MKTSLDITLRYNTLCSVQVSHDYFKDGEIKGMSIEPTLETKMWLRNNRFVYRPTANGFVIGYLKKDGGKLFGKNIDKEKLTFLITTTDNYFDTYTAYDFRKMNEIIYLSNENKNNQLSQDALISDKDKFPCLPSNFIYNFSKINDNKTTVIKDYNMTDVWKSSDHSKGLMVNLSAEAPGFYHAMEGKKKVQSFYMLPKSPRGLVAVLDLYAKNLPQGEETNYEIKFGAKSAIWRYYFVKYKESTVYERVKIEAMKKDTKILFSSPTKVVIQTGDEAIMIESK